MNACLDAFTTTFDAFTPMLPAPVIWALGWAYGAAMFYALFAGVAWAVDLLPLLVRRPVGLRFRRIRAVALAAAAVALASWGMFEGVRYRIVRTYVDGQAIELTVEEAVTDG